MEEALYQTPLLMHFDGIDLCDETIPDAGTILNFRRPLEARELAGVLFAELQKAAGVRGLLLRRGTIVDATLIQAPPSTKPLRRRCAGAEPSS